MRRVLVLALVILALAGCRRVDSPGLAPARGAQGGPYVCVITVDLDSGDGTAYLHDFGCDNDFFGPSMGVLQTIHWDGEDTSGRPVGGTTSHNYWFSIDASRKSKGTITASARCRADNVTTERTADSAITPGAITVLQMPPDRPRYAFIFCVLPDEARDDNYTCRKWKPEDCGTLLLRLDIDLNHPEDRTFGVSLIDLSRSPLGVLTQGLAETRMGGNPAGTLNSAGMWSHRKSVEDDLTVGGSVALQPPPGKPEETWKDEQALSVTKRETKVICLPKDGEPRFLFIFSILPELEPGSVQIP